MKRYEHLGWPMITFLREPIKRHISEYSMLQRTRPKVFARYKSIIDFCKKENRINIETKMLGGDLGKFSFVGVTEKYDESVNRFSKFLGVNISSYKSLNVAPNTLNIDKKILEKLRDINQEDMKLYNDALRMYK